jgi:hypothetical protein
MDPRVIAAIIAAGTAVYSAHKAGEAQKKGQNAAKDIYKKLEKEYNYENLPSLPEIEQVIQEHDIPKIAASVDKLDPVARTAQIDALARLGQQSKTGYTAEDRLAEEKARQSAEEYNKRQQLAVLSNMAQRGIGGSGQELALRNQAQQAAADTAYMGQLGAAANAQSRALEALKGYSGAAGDLRGQQINEASARDIINKYNADNKINYLKYLDDIQKRQLDRTQQDINNRLAVSAGRTGSLNNSASNQAARGQAEASQIAGIGAGASELIKNIPMKWGSGSTTTTTPATSVAPASSSYGPITEEEYINQIRSGK